MTTLIASPGLEHEKTPHIVEARARNTDLGAERSDLSTPLEEAPRAREAEAVRSWDQARLEDYRRRARAFGRPKRTEEAVDGILDGSFPASDPPPWTLGESHRSRRASFLPAERKGIVVVSGARRGKPGWHIGVTSLVGAAMAALMFVLAILVVGGVLALAVRLLHEVLAGLLGRLAY